MSDLDGFFVIDKPYGPTSHQVDSWVRNILGVEKVGHIGTLDPNATGVLVMAIGKAVKLIDQVHELPKEYICTMRFHTDVPEPVIREKLNEFVGEVYQIPPIRSAVARNLRVRTIYSISDIEISGRFVMFRVKCESGTYIRTLCTDIGYAAGTVAQMEDLRRTITGPFTEESMITLQQLSDFEYLRKKGKPELFNQYFFPIDKLFAQYPKIVVKASSIANISHGSDLYPGGIIAMTGNPRRGDRVCVVDESNKVLGTGKMLVDFNEIDVLKVVDFDRILIEPQISEEVRENAEKPVKVVRPRKRTQDISVPRPRKEFHRDIQETPKWRDSRDRGKRVEQHTRPQNPYAGVRKRKDKRKQDRR